MKAGKKLSAILMTAVLCLTGMAGSAMAEETPLGQVGQPLDQSADQQINQAIVVDENEGFHVTVSYYKKGIDGAWKQEFSVPGIYGRNGGTADKREGDGKTPYGVYSFTMAFGLQENPGSILPYHQIKRGDYWVDDSGSSHYNQLVNRDSTAKDWNSAENMSAAGVSYDYGLALNYNEDCVPGKGSAIFLHCYTQKNDSGSAGCVRIPKENMKALIQTVDSNTRIIIRSKQ